MKLFQKFVSGVLGIALICTAVASSALTLGRARGAVVIGQPLDLAVPVEIAADEDVSGMCFEAEVFYGDRRQPASGVSLEMVDVRQGMSTIIRVAVSAVVDEPFITVNLQAACGGNASRRYVILADIAADPPVPLAATPKSWGAQLALSAQTAPSAEKSSAESTRTLPTVAARGGDSMPQSPPQSKLKPSIAKAAANNTIAQAKLKLAPFDVAPIGEPNLKLSNEMALGTVQDLNKRLESVAMWRALNKTPEDVVLDGIGLQSAQSNLKALQDHTLRNSQTLKDLAERLEKSEARRINQPLVGVGLAFVLVFGLALALFWYRLRSLKQGALPWWRVPVAEPQPVERPTQSKDNVAGPEMPSPTAPLTGVSSVPGLAPDAGIAVVDMDLQLTDSVFARFELPAPTRVSKPSAPPTATVTEVPTKTEAGLSVSNNAEPSAKAGEMLDARQQADFYMALGQYDEAIEVLETLIENSSEANPLVYLDLLNVFRTLSRKTSYDLFRARFNALFSGHVPAFGDFNSAGQELETYADVCGRIAASWPSQDSVQFIEKCMVRSQDNGPQWEFDLEAFRDLLMLHALARRINAVSDAGLLPFTALPDLGPLDVPASSEPTSEAAADVSIDFDLSEPVGNLLEFDTEGLFTKPTKKLADAGAEVNAVPARLPD